jgi:hypothetical protein
MARLGTDIMKLCYIFSRVHTLIRDVAYFNFVRRYFESIRFIGSSVANYFVFY